MIRGALRHTSHARAMGHGDRNKVVRTSDTAPKITEVRFSRTRDRKGPPSHTPGMSSRLRGPHHRDRTSNHATGHRKGRGTLPTVAAGIVCNGTQQPPPLIVCRESVQSVLTPEQIRLRFRFTFRSHVIPGPPRPVGPPRDVSIDDRVLTNPSKLCRTPLLTRCNLIDSQVENVGCHFTSRHFGRFQFGVAPFSDAGANPRQVAGQMHIAELHVAVDPQGLNQ